MSYWAIGGGGSGGIGNRAGSSESRGGNGGNGGQVVYGGFSFEKNIDYSVTIGSGGISTQSATSDGGSTSIIGTGISVTALGGKAGKSGGRNYTEPNDSSIPNSSLGAQAKADGSSSSSNGSWGTGYNNYGAGGGAGASAGRVGGRTDGGYNGGGDGTGLVTPRTGGPATENTGSGGGGGAGDGGYSNDTSGGKGGSGCVIFIDALYPYNYTGNYSVLETEVLQVIINFTVTISGDPLVFYLDSSANPLVNFTANTVYIFDQSDSSNTGEQIVFGYTIDDSNIFTSANGVTVVGTPGQPGAYTRFAVPSGLTGTVYYYSINTDSMGNS